MKSSYLLYCIALDSAAGSTSSNLFCCKQMFTVYNTYSESVESFTISVRKQRKDMKERKRKECN